MLINAIQGNLSFAEVIIYALSSFVVIFLTLPIHEWAHGFVSTKLGDPTPRYQGRLTLNPMAHIDWLGAAGILLFGIVMQIQSAFSVSAIPMALAGYPSVNHSVDTILSHLQDVGAERFEMGYASAISVVLFLLIILTKKILTKFV